MGKISYEREVKVFGLDEAKVIKLLDKEYKSEVYSAMITIHKAKGGDKVKLLHEYEHNAYYLQKKTKASDEDKTMIEDELYVSSYSDALSMLKFLNYNTVFEGVKKRTKWTVSKSRNITYDEWITGPLGGISYFEFETVSEDDDVVLEDMIDDVITKAYINTDTLTYDISIVDFGTLKLAKLLSKGDINKVSKKAKILHKKCTALSCDRIQPSTKIIKLFRGTNKEDGINALNRKFNDVTWWADDYVTLAHYYEGCALEMEVEIHSDLQQLYVGHRDEYHKNYTYGYIPVVVPEGATWYSFSSKYLADNIVSIREIHPDLSKYEI